jgi:hypothetical protein
MSTIARTPPARHDRRTPAPLNCSIFLTDIVGFGDPRRDDHDRAALRSALQRLLTEAFVESGLPWRRCRHQDRGDGVLTVVPPTLSTTLLVDPLLPVLGERLRRHNREAGHPVRMRLRCALHVGPVQADGAGFPNVSVIHAARMLDSGPLRRLLTATDVDVATMVSGFVYETVVRHLRGPVTPDAFRRTRFRAKGVPITGWMYLAIKPGVQRRYAARSGRNHTDGHTSRRQSAERRLGRDRHAGRATAEQRRRNPVLVGRGKRPARGDRRRGRVHRDEHVRPRRLRLPHRRSCLSQAG